LSAFTEETYLYTVIYCKSTTTTAYQTFTFVSDSIKLGKDVAVVFTASKEQKPKLIFMTVYAIHMNYRLSY